MKKILTIITVCILMVSLIACGGSDNRPEENTAAEQQSSQTAAAGGEPKQLVVYFSQSGNTEAVAKEIQKNTGADLFEIKPQKPYPEDYDALSDVAQREQQSDARPAISGSIENFADYDVIYVGYPIWYGGMPMILYTFFDDYDFEGKTIAPFCTSGGSGLSNTVSAIQSLEPGAAVKEGFHVEGSAAADAGEDVGKWLNEIE